jgi:hypothetical protein
MDCLAKIASDLLGKQITRSTTSTSFLCGLGGGAGQNQNNATTKIEGQKTKG